MRYLWIISAIITAGGATLLLASLVAGAPPIAAIGGVLLVWSGIVKFIVLRIWRNTLPASPPPPPFPPGPLTTADQR